MNAVDALWAGRDVFVLGLGQSLLLVGLCLLISLPVAVLGFVLLRESAPAVAKALGWGLDTLRCVPFLLFAYVIYYGLPEVGLRLEPLAAGLLALVVYHSAYFIEILRAAALSIPRETLVAADAFGFARCQCYRRIVLPQLWTLARPMLANQCVMVIKDSALLMVITVQEITFAANFVSSNYYAPFAPFLLAMLLYWLMSLATDCLVARCGPRPVKRVP